MYQIQLDGVVLETATTQNLAMDAVTERIGQEAQRMLDVDNSGADCLVNARDEDGRWLQYVIRYESGLDTDPYRTHPFHAEAIAA